jgi:uncharacterized protein
MRIVFDTNVLISSTLWDNSISHRLLIKLINSKVQMFTTFEILGEYKNVLKRDFEYSEDEANKISIDLILQFLKIAEPKNKIDFIKEDSTDNKILECAVETNSDYILSYDNHLLKLKEFQGIKIITPDEFLGKMDENLDLTN